VTLQRRVGRRGHAWAPRTVSAGLTAAEQPLPWLVAAVVFFANALLTLSQGYWWLAALELGTGMLAMLSATAVAKRSGKQGRSPGVAQRNHSASAGNDETV
jgi:hypothetical protein